MERQALFMKKAVVVGGGIGGLSAAIRLAGAGYGVTILEQQAELGGKLQRVRLGGYTFDRGPSTITMRHAFESVFAAVGRRMEDYVSFVRLEEGTRNIFADGQIVDVSSRLSEMEAQIAQYCPEDAIALRSFMAESGKLYRLAEKHFMNRLLLDWKSKADPRLAVALLRVRPFVTLERLLRRYFRHRNTLALFGRYATYVGSDPARAPSIFAMLPHLETMLGVYQVQGGTYAIVDGLRRLAEELGVEVVTSSKARRIVVRNHRAAGVEADTGNYSADVVVANGDVLTLYRELLDPRYRPAALRTEAAVERYEPSLSGFVLLAGTKRIYDTLRHHNVYFPDRYEQEFEDIFTKKTPPRDPAIYVCWSGRSEAGLAPEGGSNLFILANAPYCSDDRPWSERANAYADRIIRNLERRGIKGLSADIAAFSVYTPDQLREDTSAYRGAIYGISSNSPRQTFSRPSNRGIIPGLWFVGGTTHPGGGTPMVALSGQLVANAIIGCQ